MNVLSIGSGIGAHKVAFDKFKVNSFCEPNTFIVSCLTKTKETFNVTLSIEDLIKTDEFLSNEYDMFAIRLPSSHFKNIIPKDYSHARKGFVYEILRALDRKKPRWIVWEFRPEVVISNKGRDFSNIIRGLTELGYGVSWRVLDSHFFGSPIEHRKMYVVGYFGAWEPSREVLFEEGSLIGESKINQRKKNSSVFKKKKDSEGRYLTPKEWERIKGFPDNWTKIDKNTQDFDRYKALKKSSCVHVLKFIGDRIHKVEEFLNN